MDKEKQRKKAEAFLALHHDPKLLVLPNIWDPIGARMLEGAVGINLEDSTREGGPLRDIEDQCDRLRAARATARWNKLPTTNRNHGGTHGKHRLWSRAGGQELRSRAAG